MEESLEEVISRFRKSLQVDGGDIELVDFVDGVVKVRISRTTTPVTFSSFLREHKTREGITCGSCRVPTGTIATVLEAALKDKIPTVKKVQVVK